MAALTTLAIGALAVGAGVQAYSAYEQQKTAKRNNRLQERAQAAQRRREIVSNLRQRRVQAGQAIAGAAGSGNVGSSAVQGSISSQGSQANAAIGFANQIGAINTQIFRNNESLNRRLLGAQLVGTVASAVGSYATGGIAAGQGAPTSPGKVG